VTVAPKDLAAVADSVAAAALSVPGVSRLHGGSFGEVATYLAGRQVEGVRLRDGLLEVHLAVVMGSALLEVAGAVRDAVTPLVDTQVDVFVEDVVPDE